jgi:putative flippase GtrA
MLWDNQRALRFLIVGCWNFTFGYLAFALLFWLFKESVHEIVIVLVSSILGITNSFIFHRWFTYHSKGNVWKEYFRFYIVYGVQMVLNIFCMMVFVSWLNYNAYIVQFLITVFLTILSYWGHTVFSFKHCI